MRPLIVVVPLALAMAATGAEAGTLQRLVAADALTCGPGDRASLDDVVFGLMNDAGVAHTPELYQRYEKGDLGVYMSERIRAGDEAWQRLKLAASALIRQNESAGRFRAEATDPPTGGAAPNALMNKDAPWLVIHCSKPPPAPPEQHQAQRQQRHGAGTTDWVIARTLDDASVGREDRDFATLSYTRDYESDENIVDAEIFIGTPTIGSGLGGDNPLRFYAAYQRRTGGHPVNDLTFGASTLWYLGKDDENAFLLNGTYETDDHFRSSALRGELLWEPVWADFCHRFTGGTMRPGSKPDLGFSCILRGALDIQDVMDAGNKPALQDEPSFRRLGGDFLFSSYWRLAAGGKIQVNASYGVREPFDGKDGDAAFGQISLKYVPAGMTNVAFGVEYFEGEDLTSLERDKTLKFAIGFRN